MDKADNLKPYRFQPGQSGNPGGRPKKTPLTDALRALLEKAAPGALKDKDYARAIAEALARRAARGDVSAIREVCDRVEGKPKQAVELAVGFSNLTDEELDACLAKLEVKPSKET